MKINGGDTSRTMGRVVVFFLILACLSACSKSNLIDNPAKLKWNQHLYLISHKNVSYDQLDKKIGSLVKFKDPPSRDGESNYNEIIGNSIFTIKGYPEEERIAVETTSGFFEATVERQ